MRRPHTVCQNRRRFKARMLAVLLIAIALIGISPRPSHVAATSVSIEQTVVLDPTTAPVLPGTFQVINDGPGNQVITDIDCNRVAYLNDDGSRSIRYFDFNTNTDHVIPGNGWNDLADVLGSMITFTEFTESGTVIVLFDTTTQNRTVLPGLRNLRSVLGGNFVVYEDRSFSNESEISVYDRTTSSVSRLTNDLLADKHAAVSATGNAIVWEKCLDTGLGCDLYAAIQTTPGVFTTNAFSTSAGEDRSPDTNGEIAVYVSDRSGENDIYFQPVTGGVETRLSIPGDQGSVSISGNLITFHSLMANSSQYDVFVYDLTSAKLYRVTNTPTQEQDININVCNGVGRIVYSVPTTNFDAFAFAFQPPSSTESQIEDLTEVVQNINPPAGLKNSLITKLQEALAAIDAGDTVTACASLTAFINATSAQSGKKLTADQAAQLISDAQEIKSALGCQ